MPSSRSVRKTRIAISPRFATRTLLKTATAPRILQAVSLPDTLTVARAASVPFVILLYAWNFNGHNYWATALGGFAAAGAWRDQIAWWALLVAVVLTWISGLDYARVAPRLWRGGAPA